MWDNIWTTSRQWGQQMGFSVTPQHEAIFSWVESPTTRSMIIDAVAGSGKTATLIEILRRLPSGQSAIFLAFNKSAAHEVGERARAAGLSRDGVDFRTLNSMGHRALMRQFPRARLDSNAVYARLRDEIGPQGVRRYGATVRALVSAAKSQGLVPSGVSARGLMPDRPKSWDQLIERFGIDRLREDHMREAIDIARGDLLTTLRDVRTIDFDDQLYIPMALDLPMWRNDWLLVDEAQDLNPVQRTLIGAAVKPEGHIIAVGDPYQAIYGWRGADCDSLAAIAGEYDAVTMPLSVTYRCPRAVVALAQEFVPHFTAADGAPEGTISTVGENGFADVGWRADDLVVCRMNAPLVKLAYRLIRDRVPCHVAGRDIGTGLITLVRQLDAPTLPELRGALMEWRRRETEKAEARDPVDEAKLIAITDKAETLDVFIDMATTVQGMIESIQQMFSDKAEGCLTLSSVHRAKGQERPRVFILNPNLMPSKMAKTDDAKAQERNLQYVAITRARSELVWLTPWPQDEKKRATPSKKTIRRPAK